MSDSQETVHTEPTTLSNEGEPSMPSRGSFLEVLGTFARLGLTSFGGPIAHLGYFRQEIVVRRKWIKASTLPVSIPRRFAIACWIIFFALIVGLPLLRLGIHNQGLALFDTFFRVGSLVFGGGHVVLPLLQQHCVGLMQPS